jgi:multiple sugar transport system permease protein
MQERTTARSRVESTAARPPRSSYQRATNRTGLLLVAPAVLLVAAFTLYPFAQALYTSTQLSSPLIEAKFVGLQNYSDVITSSYFLDATRTTALFTAVAVPVLVVLGVLVAVLLNEPFFGNGFLRAGMLLPWAIPASAAGVIWKWVFLDSSGALNVSLYSLGIIDDYIPWLTTPGLARMAVVVVFIWTQLPLVGILLLAALQAVPDDLYDAAAVDGASTFGRFRHVTLPGIRPMLVIVTVYEVLVALATFDLTYSLTGGGPGTATTLLTYFIWSETFNQLNFGQGAALAIVIALVSLVAIFVILRALPEEALLGEDR